LKQVTLLLSFNSTTQWDVLYKNCKDLYFTYGCDEIRRDINMLCIVAIVCACWVVRISGFHGQICGLINTIVHFWPPNKLAYGGNKSC